MPKAVLWVEGVDFDWSILDTPALSVMRGGSLINLRAGPSIEVALATLELDNVKLLMSGASQFVFLLEGAEDQLLLAENAVLELLQNSIVVDRSNRESVRTSRHFSDEGKAPFFVSNFVAGFAIAHDDSELSNAIDIAHAYARRRQYALLTTSGVDCWHGSDACYLDRKRPGYTSGAAPKDKVISTSAEARRSFGRQQRQMIYQAILGDSYESRLKDLIFCDEFEEIVRHPPAHVRQSPSSKIAVFYADGNKFGAIRDKCSEHSEHNERLSGLEDFSSRLSALQTQLLSALLETFLGRIGKPEEQTALVKIKEDLDVQKVRFETLLWGGDEVRFVMPAWMACDFAEAFFRFVNNGDWKIGSGDSKDKLTFTASCVIANVKTPIRQLIDFGAHLVSDAKEVGDREANKFVLEVLESYEPPAESIGEWRASCLALNQAPDPAVFILDGDALTEAFAVVREVAAAVPRSQLYKWLSYCSAHQLYSPCADETELEREIERYFRGPGRDDGLTLDALKLGSRSLAMSLFLVTQWADYISPFDRVDLK
jgi:hypothetical protein